jgi:hypothetical protein
MYHTRTEHFHLTMNSQKLPTVTEIGALDELARYFERNLNFLVGPDGRARYASGPEIGLLAKLDRFVHRVLETSLAPFRITGSMRQAPVAVSDAIGWDRRVIRPRYTKIAAPNSFCRATEEMASILRSLRVSSTIFVPWNKAANQLLHAPHLRLLLEVFSSHQISNCFGGGDIDLQIDDLGRIKAEVYNDFVSRFRQAVMISKSVRRECHNWHLGSRENVTNLAGYLDRLFVKHDSLTVLHLRLFHAKTRANLVTAPVEAQHRDLAALRACRAKFFDCMRRKPALFTDDPGYVWAILPSLEGGYDLHLTLLFSTVALRQVLDDMRVAAEQSGAVPRDHPDQVGAYWVEVATDSRGDYLRGDRQASLYGPDWVHGEVCADDGERRSKLKETLGYLAMRRALVRLKNEPPGQYFGMPERKARRCGRSIMGCTKAG